MKIRAILLAAGSLTSPLLCSIMAEGEEPQVSVSEDPMPVERTNTPAEPPVEEPKTEETQEAKLPEGYDSWEAYGKDVALGRVKAPTTEEAPPAETPKEPTAEEKAAGEAFEAKLAPFTAEVQEKGELSPESITKAAQEFGVTEDMVKAYLKGVQSIGAEANAPIIESVGGDWGKFNEWVVANVPADKQATLNKALQGDREVALAALAPYAEQFKSDGGANPPKTLTRGPGGEAASADVYASDAEQLRDQQNPLYKSDPAFRAKVEAKIGRTMKAAR